MPYAEAKGAKLYYEVAGKGQPIVFVHEFAGDHRSWEPQVRYFSRRYRCISYAARGYPPSDVPSDPRLYSQDIATDDIAAVLKGLGIKKAHIVGLSMGGFAALHFAIRYPRMAQSAVVAGCGYGAPKGPERRKFRADVAALAKAIEADGITAFAKQYSVGPTRVQFKAKDPRGFAEFARQLAEHDAVGAANTFRGVQGERPSIYDLAAKLVGIKVPMLLMTGDEDEPCLDATLFMKRKIPSAGLVVLPKTGHTINLEEPAAFNQAVQEFLTSVEQGRWGWRDPASISDSAVMAKTAKKKRR